MADEKPLTSFKYTYSLVDENLDTPDVRSTGLGNARNYITPLAISLLGNILSLIFVTAFLLVRFAQMNSLANAFSGPGNAYALASQYDLPGKKPVTYKLLYHGLDEDDFAAGNKYWADLFPKGGGLVLLSNDSVAAMRLAPSSRVGDEYLYEMAGYHSLHCITSIRATISRLLKAQATGKPYVMSDDDWQHLKHCIADARENTLCNLDESLLPVAPGRHPGDGQTKLCKQLEPINRWLEGNYHDFNL